MTSSPKPEKSHKFQTAIFYILLTVVMAAALSGLLLSYLATQNAHRAASDAKKAAESAEQASQIAGNISQTNQDYIRCVAEIFAKYTRDQKPISSIDFDKCTAESNSAKKNAPEGFVLPGAPNKSNQNQKPKENPDDGGNTNGEQPGPIESLIDEVDDTLQSIPPD